MSFRHEALLWLLLLVPVASAALVMGFRRKQRTDARFAGDALVERLVQGRMPRLRVARGVLIVLTLAAGECVPWHFHNNITDSFVCLEGPLVVETRAPRDRS